MNRPRKKIKAILVCLALSLATTIAGDWQSLFNGTNLSGWSGAKGFWRVENGTIVGETKRQGELKHHTYLIWRGGDLKDFELRLRFRAAGRCNSGVQYRGRELPDFDVAGYQCNIHPRKPGSTAVLEEMKNGRGGHLADIGQRVELRGKDERKLVGSTGDPSQINHSLKKDGWNDLRIIAKGRNLQHWLNGHLAIEATDLSQKAATQGVLALQLHSGAPMKIEFRNIALRKLDDD